MTIRTKLAAGVCAAAMTMAASAAPATTVIDFRIPGDLTSGVGSQTGTFSNGTVSGSVTAGAGCDFICNPTITQNATNGLGVSAYRLDDPALDGALLWESLTFQFNQTVRLLSVKFGFWDAEDDADISVGGSIVADESGAAIYSFAPNTIATSLTIKADDAFEQTGCSFSLFNKCIKKEGGPDDISVMEIEVEVVPLPAAGWLLLAGLGGIAAMKRRRRAA